MICASLRVFPVHDALAQSNHDVASMFAPPGEVACAKFGLLPGFACIHARSDMFGHFQTPMQCDVVLFVCFARLGSPSANASHMCFKLTISFWCGFCVVLVWCWCDFCMVFVWLWCVFLCRFGVNFVFMGLRGCEIRDEATLVQVHNLGAGHLFLS